MACKIWASKEDSQGSRFSVSERPKTEAYFSNDKNGNVKIVKIVLYFGRSQFRPPNKKEPGLYALKTDLQFGEVGCDTTTRTSVA
jgi:hypothetical protein